MVNVNFAAISRSLAVVRREPVGLHHGALERVDLCEPEGVTFQHLLACVAAITVDIKPMLEERAAVAA